MWMCECARINQTTKKNRRNSYWSNDKVLLIEAAVYVN